ncbi:MAG: hypothetical protein BGO21_29845 [Dyadobacter sp. 50-39]|uniref:hypothetical protein n=1 Tax=Dyadobacter sp. 50-39 TaxID=1895756 RepID=UPI00095924B8|nr:hypothetical protein [Dyadobacter sp. 50-39]OJV15210.1 MAG: hypothetical protein BGO21_29845 [Dyadobacter sp. 50-39]
MDGKYAFEWLDLAVTTILNPSKTNIAALDAGQLESIQTQIRQEINQSKTLLSRAGFMTFSRRKIQRIVSQYQKSLVLLLETAFEGERQNPGYGEKANTLSKTAREAIYELLDFIEHRFGEYIDLDCKVPSSRLAGLKQTLANRLDSVRPWLQSVAAGSPVAAIISDQLSRLSAEPSKYKPSFREVFYHQELLSHLERLAAEEGHLLDALIETLIFMNFNCRSFIDYYTGQLSAHINGFHSLTEKLNQLLWARKRFTQLHQQSEHALDPALPSVKTMVGRWLDAELDYLDAGLRWGIAETNRAEKTRSTGPGKILCVLSIDQIALILRALDSLRIIQAKSLNSVFEHIAPHLSTPRKQEISWESMRSKAYQFEASDKERVLKILDSVAKWIKEHEMR